MELAFVKTTSCPAVRNACCQSVGEMLEEALHPDPADGRPVTAAGAPEPSPCCSMRSPACDHHWEEPFVKAPECPPGNTLSACLPEDQDFPAAPCGIPLHRQPWGLSQSLLVKNVETAMNADAVRQRKGQLSQAPQSPRPPCSRDSGGHWGSGTADQPTP